MAQLRQDQDLFTALNTTILVVGPDNEEEFTQYFTENKLPFIGIPDPRHEILKMYGQEINVFKAGRVPAQFIIDLNGVVRFVHYGNSMSDIPTTGKIMARLRAMAML